MVSVQSCRLVRRTMDRPRPGIDQISGGLGLGLSFETGRVLLASDSRSTWSGRRANSHRHMTADFLQANAWERVSSGREGRMPRFLPCVGIP